MKPFSHPASNVNSWSTSVNSVSGRGNAHYYQLRFGLHAIVEDQLCVKSSTAVITPTTAAAAST